jgi:hypothetical protein
MMTSKLDSIREDVEDLKDRADHFEDNYVSHKHLTAIVQPIQDSIREMGRDIKKILLVLSRYESQRRD